MSNYSTKVKKAVLVEGIKVDDEPVFVRPARAGEALELSTYQARLAGALPKGAEAGTAEELGQAAIDNAGTQVLTTFAEYRLRWVFIHWSDKDGNRRFDDFEKFLELDNDMIQAIYTLGIETDVDPESLEVAEKN